MMAFLSPPPLDALQEVVDGEDDRAPSLEEKTKFAHNIYKIKSEELGEVSRTRGGCGWRYSIYCSRLMQGACMRVRGHARACVSKETKGWSKSLRLRPRDTDNSCISLIPLHLILLRLFAGGDQIGSGEGWVQEVPWW